MKMPSTQYIQTDNPEHCAVFAVKTPAVDHSGLSHLAEHMCFRGSNQYPNDFELFVLNNTLPISINATTYADYTFFYVVTAHNALFISAIDYLYRGLLQQCYGEDVFTTERDGVVYNELAMLEANKDYALNAAVRLGDDHKHAYAHAGGFTHTISQNSLADLVSYKKQWYTPENISVVISSSDSELYEQSKQYLLSAIQQENAATNSKSKAAYKIADKVTDGVTDTIPKAKSDKTPEILTENRYADLDNKPSNIESNVYYSQSELTEYQVFTWWFPHTFLASLQANINKLQRAVSADDRVIIDDEVNQNGDIALRLIAQHHALYKKLKHFTRVLNSLPVRVKKTPFQDKKLPQQVQKSIDALKVITPIPAKQDRTAIWKTCCQSVKASRAISLAQADKQRLGQPLAHLQKPANAESLTSSYFAKEFSQLTDSENIPALPRLLTTLAKASHADAPFVTENNHWVYRLSTLPSEQVLRLVQQSVFWQPRLSGECYAIGVGRFEDELYFYGAQDTISKQRDAWCKQLFENSMLFVA